MEHAGAVISTEIEAEGILGGGESAIRVVTSANMVSALDADSAVCLKAALVPLDVFHRDRAFPGDAALGTVARSLDSGGPPEVGIIGVD